MAAGAGCFDAQNARSKAFEQAALAEMFSRVKRKTSPEGLAGLRKS
jgi:hypothetical protein